MSMDDYFSRKYPILKFNKVDPRREKLSIETDRLLIRYIGQLSAKVGLETLETSNSASRRPQTGLILGKKATRKARWIRGIFGERSRLETFDLSSKIEFVRINSNEHV